MTPDERADWIARYQAGESTWDIARSAALEPPAVARWLRRRGVVLRDPVAAHQRQARTLRRRARDELIAHQWAVRFAVHFPPDERREWAYRQGFAWAMGQLRHAR